MSAGWLSLETRATWTWTGDFTVGAATETYSNAATDNSAYDAAEAMVAWLNAGARAWFGVAVFSWAPVQVSGGMGVSLTCGVHFDLAASAGMTAVLGLPSDVGVPAIQGAVASGTVWPVSGLKLRSWLRQLPPGSSAAVGSFLGAVPGLAPYRPTVQAIGDRADAARWAEQFALCSSPRRGWIWQDDVGQYRQVAIGVERVDRRDARSAYFLALTVAGEAV